MVKQFQFYIMNVVPFLIMMSVLKWYYMVVVDAVAYQPLV